jgi:hypothetical protein
MPNGKNEILLFCFILKMNTKEDICVHRFLLFLTVRIIYFSMPAIFFTRLRLEYKKIRSVEFFFILSLKISEI